METVHGIQYAKPQVTLLQETGIGTAEIAARTCYDSFDNSENEAVKLVGDCQPSNLPMAASLANDIEHSDLLDTLAWTHFHHCYTDDTECLTRYGWKLIKNVKKHDSIVTLNPTTKEIEYQQVTNTFKYTVDETLLHFENAQMDMMVTSNHKVYANKLTTKAGRAKTEFKLYEAKDLLTVNHCHMKTAKYTPLEELQLSLDFIRLIGFFIGDGTIASTNTIQFHIKKKRKVDFLNSLQEFDFKLAGEDTYITTPSSSQQTIFKECYNANKEKVIPLNLSCMSKAELEALLEGLIASDGSIRENGLFSYSTTSKVLMDQVQHLAFLLEYSVNITHNTRNSSKNPNWKDCATLHFSKTKYVEFNRLKKQTTKYKKVKEVAYKGDVVCVEVPNHILYIRRNGKAVFSGNSILEHANLTYLIKGMSRGALQEQARHRIQGISVRSTRYTMSSVINAFVAAQIATPIHRKPWFVETILEQRIFVSLYAMYNQIEIEAIYDKLMYQKSAIEAEGGSFTALAVAKSSIPLLEEYDSPNDLFDALQAGKKKRNVGDAFKHIVTDNWKVDLVVTFNLRSLKNYLTLRDSGAAYVHMQWVSAAIIKATPRKYLDLILSQDTINKHLR